MAPQRCHGRPSPGQGGRLLLSTWHPEVHCLQPVCYGKADREIILWKGQFGSPVNIQERGFPRRWVPPVIPDLLVSWMCPNTQPRAPHYLSWGPSLAVILCGKGQHHSQQVLWLLSV